MRTSLLLFVVPAAADPDLVAIKASTDDILPRRIPKLTIASATNANPPHVNNNPATYGCFSAGCGAPRDGAKIAPGK